MKSSVNISSELGLHSISAIKTALMISRVFVIANSSFIDISRYLENIFSISSKVNKGILKLLKRLIIGISILDL